MGESSSVAGRPAVFVKLVFWLSVARWKYGSKTVARNGNASRPACCPPRPRAVARARRITSPRTRCAAGHRSVRTAAPRVRSSCPYRCTWTGSWWGAGTSSWRSAPRASRTSGTATISKSKINSRTRRFCNARSSSGRACRNRRPTAILLWSRACRPTGRIGRKSRNNSVDSRRSSTKQRQIL